MLSFIQRHNRLIIVCGFLSAIVLLICVFSHPLTYLALDAYDTYITPYNGECAYRVLNNKCSCSEFFRNNVDEKRGNFCNCSNARTVSSLQPCISELKLRSEQQTMPACCVASACCADIMMTHVPVDSSSNHSRYQLKRILSLILTSARIRFNQTDLSIDAC